MGYTHYWTTTGPGPLPGFEKLVDATRAVIRESGIPIGDWEGLPATGPKGGPDVDATEITFNGVGSGAHETFHIDPDPDSQFCKTARKPYDRVVTAVLCLADLYFGDRIDIGSDGGRFDWGEGVFLARKIDPAARIPATITRD